MTFIQPSENPNIPEAEAKRLTLVRNQISLGEAEVKRLAGLVTSLNYQIEEATKSKIYTESQLADTQAELENHVRQLSATKQLLDESTLQLRKAEEERVEISNSTADLSLKLAEREEKVSKREEAVSQEEARVAKAAERLSIKEKELQEKIDRINQALR